MPQYNLPLYKSLKGLPTFPSSRLSFEYLDYFHDAIASFCLDPDAFLLGFPIVWGLPMRTVDRPLGVLGGARLGLQETRYLPEGVTEAGTVG